MNIHQSVQKPASFQSDLRNLPQSLAPLKALPNWVLWRWDWKPNKSGGGKWSKVPFRPANPNQFAKNNDPSTWGTYEQALAAFEAKLCDGIGFNLSGTDFAAFDIDKCRDLATGAIAPEAMALVERSGSYTEVTVSGTGLRVIGYGLGDKVHRKHSLASSTVEVESYRKCERYIVVTGNVLAGTRGEIGDLTATMDLFVAEHDGEVVNRTPPVPPAPLVPAWGAPPWGLPPIPAAPIPFAPPIPPAPLPADLVGLIERGPAPGEDHSGVFFRAVCRLRDFGMSATAIESYIVGKPIVPERYNHRLAGEIARCISHAKPSIVPPAPMQPPAKPATWIGANQICAMAFSPIKYVVPGYIAEGLTLFAGKPKLGKSWLCMEIGLAVASGGVCLGDIRCEAGDVLYLALEDNLRRLQSRINKVWMLEGMAGQPVPSRLHLATEWPRANEGGTLAIRNWIAMHPAARLVIVDVLAMFKSVNRGKDSTLYEADYLAIKELQSLAMETGIAFIVVHHTRKSGAESDPFEKVSGTLGLSGAADTTVILDRDQNGCTLYGRGRDIEEFQRAVQFDRSLCRWKALGDADEVRRTDERTVILDLLKDHDEGMTPSEIADALGLNRNNVKQLLFKMAKAGEIIKITRGKYINPAAHKNHGDKPPFSIGADDE